MWILQTWHREDKGHLSMSLVWNKSTEHKRLAWSVTLHVWWRAWCSCGPTAPAVGSTQPTLCFLSDYPEAPHNVSTQSDRENRTQEKFMVFRCFRVMASALSWIATSAERLFCNHLFTFWACSPKTVANISSVSFPSVLIMVPRDITLWQYTHTSSLVCFFFQNITQIYNIFGSCIGDRLNAE